MSNTGVQEILQEIEDRLSTFGELPSEIEVSIGQLLNVVEALCSDKQTLVDEVERLQQQLQQKKKSKTTDKSNGSKPNSDHSSEKKRPKDKKPKRPSAGDRRSFKDLTIHETIECPVDPSTLLPDAVRVEDEEVLVQDIEIKPHNIRFLRSVYYSSKQKKYFRGALPSGYDTGDFGADLRALILSLKYCGNMSEPEISELLEDFDVQISSGSISNILTKTADSFAKEFDAIVQVGLASTRYQSRRAGISTRRWSVLAHPHSLQFVLRGLFYPAAQRSPDGAGNTTKHGKVVFSVWSGNFRVVAKGVQHSPEVATHDRSDR